MTDYKNNLRALLIGGEGSPEYAPEGLLALRRMSVMQLARKARVTRTAVYNYINGVNRPTAPVLRKVCEALGVLFEEGLRYCDPAPVGNPRLERKAPVVNIQNRKGK